MVLRWIPPSWRNGTGLSEVSTPGDSGNSGSASKMGHRHNVGRRAIATMCRSEQPKWRLDDSPATA